MNIVDAIISTAVIERLYLRQIEGKSSYAISVKTNNIWMGSTTE